MMFSSVLIIIMTIPRDEWRVACELIFFWMKMKRKGWMSSAVEKANKLLYNLNIYLLTVFQIFCSPLFNFLLSSCEWKRVKVGMKNRLKTSFRELEQEKIPISRAVACIIHGCRVTCHGFRVYFQNCLLSCQNRNFS